MEAEVIYGGLKNTTFVTVYLHSKAKLQLIKTYLSSESKWTIYPKGF